MTMRHPARDEAGPYFFRYIDRIASDDVVGVLEEQLGKTMPMLEAISEERSLYRYAPDKWSFRQVLSHVNDAERIFVCRALWFARGFASPLPGFDETTSLGAAAADRFSWASHIGEFAHVRRATLAFFRNLSEEAWDRRGVANDTPCTVRAAAYITAGHLSHHLAVLRERYS